MGNASAYYLKHFIGTIVSLNLSCTKLGTKGCLELTKNLKITVKSGVNKLQYLDLSQNNIGTEGFMKLAKRLRQSDSLLNLNVSGNQMNSGDFTNFEKFLSGCKSLVTLNISHCGLPRQAFMFLGDGISKNSTLQKLTMTDNDLSDPVMLKFICDGIISSKVEPKLVELDLQRCGINEKGVVPIARLLKCKYKLRVLNLRDNAITDDGASELLQAF